MNPEIIKIKTKIIGDEFKKQLMETAISSTLKALGTVFKEIGEALINRK